MKCQRCTRQATRHITEVLENAQIEDLHLCEGCCEEFLREPLSASTQKKKKKSKKITQQEEPDEVSGHQCPSCGLKFIDYRNTTRLGCANDYQVFREELLPLLESIHGEKQHCGKIPKRFPENRQIQLELSRLRRDLNEAISKEQYETAARLRDDIRRLEAT
jgi:protein arginine kinase activator